MYTNYNKLNRLFLIKTRFVLIDFDKKCNLFIVEPLREFISDNSPVKRSENENS